MMIRLVSPPPPTPNVLQNYRRGLRKTTTVQQINYQESSFLQSVSIGGIQIKVLTTLPFFCLQFLVYKDKIWKFNFNVHSVKINFSI